MIMFQGRHCGTLADVRPTASEEDHSARVRSYDVQVTVNVGVMVPHGGTDPGGDEKRMSDAAADALAEYLEGEGSTAYTYDPVSPAND